MSGEIDLINLVKFYDEKNESNKGHSPAVTSIIGEELGVELIKNYFVEKGARVGILGKPYTVPNTGSGNWLDRWIEVEKYGKTYHYQTEIKNWSAHSAGGKQIRLSATEKELSDHRKKRWKHYWLADQKALKQKRAEKVLRRMQPARNNVGADVEIRPLICFWDAMHKKGYGCPLFYVEAAEVEEGGFTKLWVFSMSNYVRQLIASGKKTLEMDFPEAIARMKWIDQLYKISR